MRKIAYFLMALALMGVVAWGVMFARRNDSGSGAHQGGVSGDGFPAPITVDANGRLWVHGASGLIDDGVFTPGTSLVDVIAGQYDDTTPDSVSEGDAGALRMSANRNLYMTIRDAAGNERGANVDASGQLGVVEANSATIAGDTTAIEAAVEATGWTIASAAVNLAAGARGEVVATAGSGKAIRVLGFMGTANVAGSITFESAANALSGVIPVAAKGGVVLPVVPAQNVALGAAWFTTNDNEALNITTVTCEFDGVIVYATED